MMRMLLTVLIVVCAWTGSAAVLRAHDGPPFPIVTDRPIGAYLVSIWTDPDTTDDGSAGGQFWILVAPQEGAGPAPSGTRATVTISPLDRPGEPRSAEATPVRDDPSTQFAGVVLDHEGRFGVRVAIDGPLGDSLVESEVEATYDLRPPPALIAVYLLPFVLAGLLWSKLLLRRRKAQAS